MERARLVRASATLLACLLLARSRAAGAGERFSDQCIDFYNRSEFRQSIDACQRAASLVLPDLPRLKSILAQPASISDPDAAYAADRSLRLYKITYARAQLAQHFGESHVAKQYTRDSAIWILDVAAILQKNDPHHVKALTREYEPAVRAGVDSLKAIDPDIFMNVFSEAIHP